MVGVFGSGCAAAGAKGRAITLSHPDSTAENSLDKPDAVVPVESEFKPAGRQFSYTFAPNSFTILRLPLGGTR